MSKVFISYSHTAPDQDVARALRGCFLANGFEVFLDTDIETGVEWSDRIEAELRDSQYLVVLVSAVAARRPMVRHEIRIAHRLKEAGRLRILPVYVDFEGELDYELGAYLTPIQHTRWRPGEPLQDLCDRLLAAIRSAPPQPLPIETSLEAPLPVADTGTMQPDSPFYVRRQEDDILDRALRASGFTAVVYGARQMGKSSLLARAMAIARERGLRTCYLDFLEIDDAGLASLRSLLQSLASRMALEFRIAAAPEQVWNHKHDKASLSNFVEDEILRTGQDVLFCLDEVDRIFDLPYRDEFFSLVRVWHNNRAVKPLWKRCSLVLAHSTAPHLWIQDLSRSPFNVGERMRLSDFGHEHVRLLNEKHGSPLKGPGEVDRLMGLIGGQPYLVRQALYYLSTRNWTMDDLSQVATLDSGPFGDHLRYLVRALHRNPDTREAVRRLLRHYVCDDEMQFQRLLAAGLVTGNSRKEVRLRCELYRQYLEEHL